MATEQTNSIAEKPIRVHQMSSLEELGPHIVEVSNSMELYLSIMTATIDGKLPGYEEEGQELVYRELLNRFRELSLRLCDIAESVESISLDTQTPTH